jgi:hypothetical protein
VLKGLTVTNGPLDHVIGFWRPSVGLEGLQALASYRKPGEPLLPAINAWRPTAAARTYRVAHDGTEFSLYASVHAIDVCPEAADIVAEILDSSGDHYSYVLWYPDEHAVVVPFDPNAAVEAFWRERYVSAEKRTILPGWLLSSYYKARPLIPTALKARLRRLVARRADASEHFLEWPLDLSLDRLQRLMLHALLMVSGREELPFVWFWPEGRPWAAVLTHDVETAEGLARVPHVIELELRRGFHSSFNLVPLDYEIPESLLTNLRENGFEIGVHGTTHDGLLFSAWTVFSERVVTINSRGRRWGSSGFRSPATYRNLDWLHLLEFEYDSSVSNSAPYEPQPGGCASCFPYAIDTLIELPITLPQDHTLFSLLKETSSGTWLSTLRKIVEVNGVACVLTHPDPAEGYIGRPENEAHYRELLEALADSHAWVPLPRELVRWWRLRAATPDGEIDRIGGVTYGVAALDSSGRLDIRPPRDER